MTETMKMLRDAAEKMGPFGGININRERVIAMIQDLEQVEKSQQTKPASELYDTVIPKHSFDELILPPYITESITDLLEDLEFAAALKKHDLEPRQKLLIHGPSGCGKTSIGHALAKKLGLPMFRASLGGILSSMFGDSEKHIASLFKFAQDTNAVILLDEVDSFLASRTEDKNQGALMNNRLVNQFLVELEICIPKGILVACTNMFRSLDPAVKRRFDMTLELPGPGKSAMREIAKKTIKPGFDFDYDRMIEDSDSPAILIQAMHDKMRRIVIDREKAARAKLKAKTKRLV